MGTRNNVNANRKWLRQKNNEAKTKDELNYEELREFGQEGSNRFCFDCHQRGPTYVNMTIGSFVCMRCSGLLRGLTPPHRVKSMSMATFTPEEVQYIKERGNDYCKQVWLSLYENNTAFTQSTDEQDIKDFMMQKYERKRYYVDPNVAGITLRSVTPTSTENHNHITNNNNVINSTKFIKVKPPSTSSNSSPITLFDSPKTQEDDFIADFSKADIFIAAPPPPPPSSLSHPHNQVNSFNSNNINNNHISNESFANFENNPIFNATATTSAPGVQVKPVMSKLSSQLTSSPAPAPPPEDRYAALKDLDDAFKNIQQHHVEPVAAPASDWMFVPNNSPHQGSFGSSSSSFQDIWNPFSNAPTPMTVPMMPTSSVFNANPFRAFNGNQISPASTTDVNINPFKMNMAASSSSTTYSNNPFL